MAYLSTATLLYSYVNLRLHSASHDSLAILQVQSLLAYPEWLNLLVSRTTVSGQLSNVN